MSTQLTLVKKREVFLIEFAKNGNVSEAARIAGIDRGNAYHYRKTHPEFAAAWDEAEAKFVERLEKEADRRGMEGTLKPVFYQGQKCGDIREYSDILLIFRLKALRPDKYRERSDVNVKAEVKTYKDLSPQERENLLKSLREDYGRMVEGKKLS